jgi:hypothetical protein
MALTRLPHEFPVGAWHALAPTPAPTALSRLYGHRHLLRGLGKWRAGVSPRGTLPAGLPYCRCAGSRTRGRHRRVWATLVTADKPWPSLRYCCCCCCCCCCCWLCDQPCKCWWSGSGLRMLLPERYGYGSLLVLFVGGRLFLCLLYIWSQFSSLAVVYLSPTPNQSLPLRAPLLSGKWRSFCSW